MEKSSLIEVHYLPSLEYLCAILPFMTIVLEGQEHFIKQTYRNRCYINTAQGKKMLTVPLYERHGKVLTKEVLVEMGNKWRNNHWRTIESAYRKAPYFDYYADELRAILFKGHELLFDLNRDLMSFCLRHIGFQKKISETMAFEAITAEKNIDLRSVISCKKPFSDRNYYQPKSYYQVFGNEFVPNLSFVDLLFCEGPRANAIISSSCLISNK